MVEADSILARFTFSIFTTARGRNSQLPGKDSFPSTPVL
jgi:hypothetical protein